MNSPNFNYRLFGLEPRDIKVYRTMLSLDEYASIRTIAAAANLNRGTTFEIIKKLVTLGLVVSHFKNKRRYYAAQPPSALRVLATEKHYEMTEQLENVEQFVLSMEEVKKSEPNAHFTQFYEGQEEIAALLRDVLETVVALDVKEYHVISSAEISNHLYGKFRNFTRQRIKKGIFAYVIGVGEGGELAELAERRWITPNKIPAAYIIIYGNKVAQISLTDTGNIQGVVVQNQGIAQLQLLVFHNLWAKLKAQ